MNERPTPETDVKWQELCCSNLSWYHIAENIRAHCKEKERERDEAREALRTLAEHGENEIQKLIKERDEAIDKYQSLQKTFEEWQLKFLSEQAELLHNKDVQRDKLFDEAHQIRIERDEARDALEHAQMTIGSIVSPSDKATLELIKVTKERDEAREALMKIEDRCVDCEDACDDIQKIRDIAVKALEGEK